MNTHELPFMAVLVAAALRARGHSGFVKQDASLERPLGLTRVFGGWQCYKTSAKLHQLPVLH